MNYSRFAVVSFAIFLFTISLSLVPALLFLVLLRYFVMVLAKIFRPDLEKIVSGMDAIFAINSTQYPAGSCLVFALTEGGSFNIQVFRDLFFNRIISFKKDQEFLYQKLQQNWTNFLGFAFWRRDPYFNLRNHIRNFDYQGEMALPSPCNQADIVKLAGQFQDLKWLGNQSPWEILLIPDYLSSKLEKHSVVIFRLHHILLDGYSFISLIRQLFQLPCEIPKCKLISDAQLSKFECLALPLQIFYEIADYSVEIFSLRRFNFNCREGSSVCAVTEPMSIEFIKFIKNKFGVSFSTVIHAALAGAIQKALKDINEDVPESLNFAFPIPKANHPDGLINDVYLGQGVFPIQVPNRAERLALIQKSSGKNRMSRLIATDVTTTLVGILPIACRTMLKNRLNRNVDISMSNLPCARNVQDYQYKDIRLVDMLVFVPGGNHGIMSILSGVGGNVRLGVTIFSPVNANLIGKLVQYVREELEEMTNLTLEHEMNSPSLHEI